MTERALDAHRVLRAAGIVLALGAGAALLVVAAEVFLVAFAGILIANLLRTPSEWLSEKTGVAPNWYVGVVTLILIVAIGLGS